MKNLFHILLVAFAVTIAGCALKPTTPPDPASAEFKRALRIQSGVRLAAFIGASTDLRAHPERRAGYVAASSGLAALVAQEQWSVSALSVAVAQTGNDRFSNADTVLLIIAGANLADVIVSGDQVDLQNVKYVKPVIIGASEGIKMALESTR